MTFTDPPYNVPIDGHATGRGAVHHRDFAMACGEMSEAEFTSFLTLACRLMARNSREGSVHYVCTDWRHMGELLTAGNAAYSELLNLCVWTKNNPGMGSFYRSQHELVFVFKSGRGRHRNNVQLGQFGRNRSNVWLYPGVGTFGRGGEEGNLAAVHPTVKPARLVADAIMDCSARGDMVLDPFLGSGTTVIAAERVGQRCYGIEIDPLYVDTAIRRWQAYTGEAAVHATSGMRFDDLAAAAEAKRAQSYTVGRGKPPQRTKFKKGQSGNPKGRPKGSKNFASTIQAELGRRVTVSEDGHRKRITKREAVAKQLVNKAAAGDQKAIPVLLREVLSHESESTAGASPAGFRMTAEDDLVLENIIKRIRESTPTERGTAAEATAPPSAGPMETAEKQPEQPDEPDTSKMENGDAGQPS